MTDLEITDASPTPSPICEGCGREAATVIDDKGWCVDCLHERGSCCSGE